MAGILTSPLRIRLSLQDLPLGRDVLYNPNGDEAGRSPTKQTSQAKALLFVVSKLIEAVSYLSLGLLGQNISTSLDWKNGTKIRMIVRGL